MAEKEASPLYAAVMVKGTVKITRNVLDTLEKLKLGRPNSCAVVPSDLVHKGMLKKVAEFATWGEVTEETLANLLQKRGRMAEKDAKAAAKKAVKEGTLKGIAPSTVFSLSPPSGGLRRVRLNYPRGDTGYRGAEINKLVERMI